MNRTIAHLLELIRFDFCERHSAVRYTAGGVLSHSWWDHPERRKEMNDLRANIHAVRVLRGCADPCAHNWLSANKGTACQRCGEVAGW